MEHVVGTIVIFSGSYSLGDEFHAHYMGLCSYRFSRRVVGGHGIPPGGFCSRLEVRVGVHHGLQG